MNRKIFYILIIGILAIASSISIGSSVVYAGDPDPPASITISSNVDTAKPGDLIEITVFIQNHGQYDLSNVLLNIGIPNGLTFVSLQTNHNNVQFDESTGMLNFNNLKKDAGGSGQEVLGTKKVVLIFRVNDDFNGTLNFTAMFQNLTTWGADGDSLLGSVNPANPVNITVNNQNTNESGNNATNNHTTNDNNNTENNSTSENNNNQNNTTENNNTETTTNTNETIIEEGEEELVVQTEIPEDEEKNDTKKNNTIKKPSKNPFSNPKPGSGSIPTNDKKSSNPSISTGNSTGSYNSFDSLDSSEEKAPDEAKATELKTNNSSSGNNGENLLAGFSNPLVAILTSAGLLGLGIIGYFYGIRP